MEFYCDRSLPNVWILVSLHNWLTLIIEWLTGKTRIEMKRKDEKIINYITLWVIS
jgi:hypothetical protein